MKGKGKREGRQKEKGERDKYLKGKGKTEEKGGREKQKEGRREREERRKRRGRGKGKREKKGEKRGKREKYLKRRRHKFEFIDSSTIERVLDGIDSRNKLQKNTQTRKIRSRATTTLGIGSVGKYF